MCSNRKVIPISISDKQLLEFLETKENVSAYIRELIKNDMNDNNKLSDETKSLIDKYIREKLGFNDENGKKNSPR